MKRWLLWLMLLCPLALPATPAMLAAARMAAERFAASLPQGAVVRVDTLASQAGQEMAWRLGAELTQRGVRLWDPAQQRSNHMELLRQQDDPTLVQADAPGGFLPPSHRIWGEASLREHRRLGKRYTELDVRLGLDELATGVTISRFDAQQSQRHNPPVWSLLAVFVASLLLVVLVNVLSRGYLGAPALFIALGLDLLYLAWFVFA